MFYDPTIRKLQCHDYYSLTQECGAQVWSMVHGPCLDQGDGLTICWTACDLFFGNFIYILELNESFSKVCIAMASFVQWIER